MRPPRSTISSDGSAPESATELSASCDAVEPGRLSVAGAREHAEQIEGLDGERLDVLERADLRHCVDETVQVALIQALHTRRGYDE